MKFIKGMDISMVKELEHYGASYRLNGKKEDLFAILKTCGANNVNLSEMKMYSSLRYP